MARARTLTRRHFLGAMTLPWWAAACRGVRDDDRIEGEIVGPSVSIGHRLRERAAIVPPLDSWRDVAVAIVGGGVAGLAAGRALLQRGVERFVVLELEPVVGGTARAGASGVTAYPWGAHYLVLPDSSDRPMIDFLSEHGVLDSSGQDEAPRAAERYLCRDPQERLFLHGRWYEGTYPLAGASAADRAELARFQQVVARWAAVRDQRGRPAFGSPLSRCSDDPDLLVLDRLCAAEWLDREGFRSTRLRWWLEYACRDDYGAKLTATSAWALLFYFASRLQTSGEERPIVTWPSGNGWLVERLARGLGNRVESGWAVASIDDRAAEHADRPVELVLVSHDGARARGIRAQRVIFAAPLRIAPYLLRRAPAERIEAWRQFEQSAWLVANLHLDQRPAGHGFAPAWDSVIYASPSLGYVTATHQSGRDHGPTVLTYYMAFADDDPSPARQRLLEADWSALKEGVVTDLERAHPDLRQLVRRIDLMRWGHAMVRPKPGLISGAARQLAQRPLGKVHFAHTDLSGVALFEEAFDHGCRAATEVAAALAHQAR